MTVKRQCELLGIPRSSCYYRPRGPRVHERDEEAAMARIDELHVEFPCYGARKLSHVLRGEGFGWCSRRVVSRLMSQMGVRAVYPGPRTSKPGKAGKFPYLLAGKPVTHPNQVWSTDITYIRLGRSHVYLSAVIDWFSRYIVAWRLHDDMGARNSVRCMEDAFRDHGVPSIANSDQGATYTADEYVGLLEEYGVTQSMDGRGRWRDNVVMERFWRTLKQECVYISEYSTYAELRDLIAAFVDRYNDERIHESLGYETPAQWYFSGINALPAAA